MAENTPGSFDQGARTLPRFGLALASALHALPLLWAAIVVPWRAASWFSAAVGLLGLLHLVVLALALASRARALELAWRVLAISSLLVLAAITWVALTSALYLIELYGSVGRAVAGGLFGAWAACALLTLPIACWGLAHTWKPLPQLNRRMSLGLAVLVLVAVAASLLLARSARADELSGVSPNAFERALKAARKGKKPVEAKAALFHALPARCAVSPDDTRFTLLVTSLDRGQKPAARCLQAPDLRGLVRRLQRALEEDGAPEGPALLELVTAVRPIPRLHPLLDALSLRPARDGVCADRRCFASWQLVALDAFGSHRPLQGLASARIGVSLPWLADLFGAEAEQLIGIETRSYVLDGDRLRRRTAGGQALDRPKTLATALQRAERFIVAAQQESGAFRYTLDPYSGQAEVAAVTIPRQSGTALVLCELGAGRDVERTARRALKQLSAFQREVGDRSVLMGVLPLAQLGSTALPLAAFASCRELVGSDHDQLIARMTRALLAFQRSDGSFFPELDTATGAPHGVREPFYASGQAVLALVLAEQLALRGELGGMVESGVLRDAVERAMDHYSSRYWPLGLRDLFFLEENWHCLAARAALGSHRHDGYERFCSDYVAFKSRLIQGELEAAEPSRVGGYTFSNVVPPHTSTSAGFAEALAAAIAVKRARNEESSSDAALLRQVLGFLLNRQWTPEGCAACAPGKEAVGGFSESEASPVIRIDYVQHAMAALGHGGRVLGVLR